MALKKEDPKQQHDRKKRKGVQTQNSAAKWKKARSEHGAAATYARSMAPGLEKESVIPSRTPAIKRDRDEAQHPVSASKRQRAQGKKPSTPKGRSAPMSSPSSPSTSTGGHVKSDSPGGSANKQDAKRTTHGASPAKRTGAAMECPWSNVPVCECIQH